MLTLIRCPFHPLVTTVARKRLQSFCQKCRWQVTPKYAYIFDPMKSEKADYAAVQAWCGNLSGNKLTRNSSSNTQSQSSQLIEPLWTDSGLKSGISVHELISTSKKRKKKVQAGNEVLNILPKSLHLRKELPLQNEFLHFLLLFPDHFGCLFRLISAFLLAIKKVRSFDV